MKKILIVEDELAYIQLLRDQLESRGYTTIEAHDGKEGLDMARRERPDLILLDIRMPVMDGMTVLHELRKDAYGKLVKVILLTNLDPNDTIIREVVSSHPAYYFIKSNVKLEDLLQKIEELLEVKKNTTTDKSHEK